MNKTTLKKGKLKNLLISICEEHMKLAPKDSSAAYIWYLYAIGTKQGHFKPFIPIAEINLNHKMGIITDVERSNLLKMLDSPDPDNVYIAMIAIGEFRRQRHDQYGKAGDNLFYEEVTENYDSMILSLETLAKTLKPYDRV